MKEFLWGALSMGSFTVGAFFLRFWLNTRDRLFLLFALAFWALMINWAMLGVLQTIDEARHYAYAIRLLAFGLIIAAIIDKNRRG